LAVTRTRGISAAIVLATAIVGLPLALAETVGNPIHQWPSLSTGQLTDTGVIAILASVFWLAWLSFVIPAGLEIVLTVVARVTRHPQRQIRLPMLGAQQDLARTLISAVLLLLPAASSAIAAAAPAAHQPIRLTSTTLAAETHHRVATIDVASHKPATKSYVIPDVGGMRSYWALAEHFLGDGARWREIWRINEGRVHADGTVMDSPRQLHAGWTILIPTGVEHQDQPPTRTSSDVTVKSGDTLSGIAAAGGARDWQQLWRLNADREEPNGRRFTDPDLIDPGWTVSLPSTHHPIPGHTTAPSGGSRRPAQPRSDPATPPHGGRPSAASPGADLATPRATPRQAGTGPGDASQVPTAATTASPTATDRAGSSKTTTADGEEHDRFPVIPLGVGLSAAAVLVVVDRARRIAQRRRRIGHRLVPPPPPLRRVEAELRHGEGRTRSAASAVELALHLAAPAPVTIRALIARNDGAVDLRLTEEDISPIPPFVPVTGGWRLPADAAQFGFAVEDCDDPHPLFAPIGSTSDGQILVDLAAGPVTVAGPDAEVRRYLIYLASAIAGAPWAMRVQVHVPPWLAADAGPLDRLTSDDATCPRPPASAADATGPSQEEPGWRTAPLYLYCGWSTDDHLDPLLAAAATPASNVHAILRASQDAAGETWNLKEGRLQVPRIIEPITVPDYITGAAAAVDLIEHARNVPDVPVGHPDLPDHDADAPQSLPAIATRDFRTNTPAPPDVESETPNVSPPTSTVLGSDQPRRLLLLGPVELTGTGKLRRAQVLNVLAFLALHRRGVSRDQFIDALWPKQPPSGQTVRNRLVDSRALVDGAISEGPPWRLDESIGTDWQEFTALAAGSPDQQRQALQLIRGRPFDGLDDAHWLHIEGFRSEVEAAIVDLALTVAERDLETGNYPGALAAARKGLLASRYEERLHRLGIRAALAQGLDGIADTLEAEMRIALDLDIEPEDTVQPETLALARVRREHRSAQTTPSRS
jgi:DNA-binding SARP family transcriptional activator